MRSHTLRRILPILAFCLAMSAHAVAPRAVAPDFTLRALDDDWITLSALRGDVVLLNFWASWCPPCRAEIPLLIDLHDASHEGLTILGINVDEAKEGRLFAAELGITYTVLLDVGAKVTVQYGVSAIPTNVVVTAAGKVHSVHVGFLNAARFRASVERSVMAALAERPRPVQKHGKLATAWGTLKQP